MQDKNEEQIKGFSDAYKEIKKRGFEFYLSYYIGEKSFSKTFNSMSDLENFLIKLCEVSQTDTIYLNSCEFKLKNKKEKKDG